MFLLPINLSLFFGLHLCALNSAFLVICSISISTLVSKFNPDRRKYPPPPPSLVILLSHFLFPPMALREKLRDLDSGERGIQGVRGGGFHFHFPLDYLITNFSLSFTSSLSFSYFLFFSSFVNLPFIAWIKTTPDPL